MIASVLDEAQIYWIHEASLRILERTGVHLPHADMLRRFAEAGANVDFEKERVRIPGELVARCVRTAGKRFTIYGRDPSLKAEFGLGKRNYNSIAGEASWVDGIAKPRRYATLDDVATAARFGDGLSHLTIVGSMADPHDVPVAHRCVAVFAEMLRNTTKPITFWYHNRATARFINEIMIAVRGGEQRAAAQPLCYPFLEPISPLRFPFNGVDLLYETAKLNLAVPIGPMAQMGMSAPMSLAGTMAVENAEILAGICITQLIREGMPVCYGGICHAFDMRSTQLIFCGPEQAIFGVAMTQMGKHYGLPVYVNTGLTDSKRPDAQAGLESAATLMLSAAAGADIFGHMGICGVDQATSLEMLMMQHEVIRYVESTMRELDFSDEAFALDLVDELGPGGNFIDTDHTALRFRDELWMPRLLDRDFFQAWLDRGASSMEDRCVSATRELLDRHRPTPLADDLDAELRRIVTAAQKEC